MTHSELFVHTALILNCHIQVPRAAAMWWPLRGGPCRLGVKTMRIRECAVLGHCLEMLVMEEGNAQVCSASVLLEAIKLETKGNTFNNVQRT